MKRSEVIARYREMRAAVDQDREDITIYQGMQTQALHEKDEETARCYADAALGANNRLSGHLQELGALLYHYPRLFRLDRHNLNDEIHIGAEQQ